MSKSNNTWKSKIDPAFDEVAKSYVALIREHKELLGDGHFGVKDEFCEYLNGLKGIPGMPYLIPHPPAAFLCCRDTFITPLDPLS